ncbi:MAG: 4'-phosphopantetheinyl transferase superfamily protein, partial [Planctomycetota bacterium]
FAREVFARETGRDARDFAFDLGPNGKPRIASGELHFNLTHTGEHALLAVGDRELGIDAEEIRGERVDGPLAQRVMTGEEFETWSHATRADQVRAFFRLWSAKESVMKATGLGMQLSPASFAVLAPGTLALAESVAIESQMWTLRELGGPPDIAVALATQGLELVSQLAFE